MYVILYVYLRTYLYHFYSYQYPVTIFALLFYQFVRSGNGSSWVWEVMWISWETPCWRHRINNSFCPCTNINLEAPIIPKPRQKLLEHPQTIFHHSSILERARVHKGINCGATFKCESSFTTNQLQLMNISMNPAVSAKYAWWKKPCTSW